MGDTELIIEFLNKQFSKDLNRSYTEEQLALSTATRLMLEEHAFWGMAIERFVHRGKNFKKVTSKGLILDHCIRVLGAFRIKSQTYSQGLGRHTESEIFKLVSKDLKAVSVLLGRKKFILGDEPCQDDCAIFGILSQFVWGIPESPYEKLINDELHNLKEYCRRMKDTFFENWDELLAK